MHTYLDTKALLAPSPPVTHKHTEYIALQDQRLPWHDGGAENKYEVRERLMNI